MYTFVNINQCENVPRQRGQCHYILLLYRYESICIFSSLATGFQFFVLNNSSNCVTIDTNIFLHESGIFLCFEIQIQTMTNERI